MYRNCCSVNRHHVYGYMFLKTANAIVCRCHLEICNFSTNLEPP
ncbi:hypothetical protein Hanom_Chr14g01296941 [Helianthus anomalus]